MAKLLLLMALLCSACATSDDGYTPARRQFTNAESKEYADNQFAVYDPIEGTNKQLYKFNALADEYVLLPIVDGYQYITPQFVRHRVSNFFLNIGEFTNFTNSVLQLQAEKAAITLGRFGVNTTVGLLGTFDVASDWGLKRQPEDFGKTLGHYGVGDGAYIVLPLLGPSNVRDTVGTVVDIATFSLAVPNDIESSVPYEVVDYGLRPIDARSINQFRYFESGSPFEYELVRYIATQSRDLTIQKEKMDSQPSPQSQRDDSLVVGK